MFILLILKYVRLGFLLGKCSIWSSQIHGGTKYKVVVMGWGERGHGELLFTGERVSVLQDEMWMDGDDGCKTM